MRKRKYVIGATLALAASVAMAAVAHATVDSQTLTVKVTQSKQDKKIFGPADLDVDIATTETAPTSDNQTPIQTDVDFDRDFKFTPGSLPTCGGADPKSLLKSTTTAAALAACPGAQVGSGTAFACPAKFGCLAQVPFVVTAFNGARVNGNATFILHARSDASSVTLILIGTLIPSPAGPLYGQRLSVAVDDTSSTGLHLRDFHVIVPKTQSVKKKKGKAGKPAKPAKYYISAKCSGNKTWDFQETTQYRGGAPTLNAKAQVACTQKKTKPKK